jgi:sugar lactone lactonase YvrE
VIQALATMSRPGELVGHERSLYWTEPDAGEVRRLHRQGGRIVTLASDQQAPAHLGVGDAGVFWATRSFEIVRAHADSAGGVVLAHFGTPITGLVVDGLDVLVALQSGELWRVPGAGGQTVRLLRAQQLSHGFVSDGTRLYWIDDKEGALKSASKSGSMIERVTSASTGPTCLALTREEIIWSEADAGTIQCIAKQGSWASTAIAAELPVPGELAVAGSWIAWINRADGSVMALRR